MRASPITDGTDMSALEPPGITEGSNLLKKKKGDRGNAGRQTEAICFLDGEIICILKRYRDAGYRGDGWGG